MKRKKRLPIVYMFQRCEKEGLSSAKFARKTAYKKIGSISKISSISEINPYSHRIIDDIKECPFLRLKCVLHITMDVFSRWHDIFSSIFLLFLLLYKRMEYKLNVLSRYVPFCTFQFFLIFVMLYHENE